MKEPPAAFTKIVVFALEPALTLTVEGLAATVKSTPMPFKETVCGLPAALSVTLSVPFT